MDINVFNIVSYGVKFTEQLVSWEIISLKDVF